MTPAPVAAAWASEPKQVGDAGFCHKRENRPPEDVGWPISEQGFDVAADAVDQQALVRRSYDRGQIRARNLGKECAGRGKGGRKHGDRKARRSVLAQGAHPDLHRHGLLLPAAERTRRDVALEATGAQQVERARRLVGHEFVDRPAQDRAPPPRQTFRASAGSPP